MFCTNCGNQVPDGARFCEQCGAMVSSPALDPQPSPFMPYDPTIDTVMEPAPAPVAEPEELERPKETAAPPVKEKKKLLPIILILAVVVVVAVVAAVLLFGKQTVYLVRETVTYNTNSLTMTERYEYDEDGRITKYEFGYSDDPNSIVNGHEICYEYDNKGKLESAEFKSYNGTIEVDYIYKDGVLDGFETDGYSYFLSMLEVDVECDDEGRFESICFVDKNGEEYSRWEFDYHDNGVIKESAQFQSLNDMKTVSRFNEEGKTVEYFFYHEGKLHHRFVYDYDEAGRQTLVEQYDGDSALSMRYEIEYSLKKDKLAAVTLNIESMDDEGEMMESTIVFECQWDGQECTMTVDEIDCDEETLEELGFGNGDVQILIEKDRHGNTVAMEMIVEGETVTETTTEYEAFQVPRSYKKIDIRNDPLYLYFLSNL